MTKTAITPEIIRALKAATEAAGSESELALKSGVNRSTLNMLSNGNTQSITSANWDKLLPFLSPYLKNNDYAIIQTVNGHHNHGSINANCEAAIIDKILDSDLSSDEKVKFIELVRK